MKSLKKVLSLILVTVMALGMMSFSSFADEEPAGINLKVTASTEEKLKAGDELTAVVTVPAPAEEFAAGTVRMDFNKDILEATSVSVTGMTSPTVSEPKDANNNGYAAAAMFGAENIKQTEDIVLTAVFRIKEGVYEDDYKDLITVNQEETEFTDVNDEKVTVAFDESAVSYGASIAGKYKVVIPEGATFEEIWTDADTEEDVAHIKITDTGRTITNSGNGQSAKLFKVTVPYNVHKVYFKWYKSDAPYVMFGKGAGWNYPQQWGTNAGRIDDSFENDEYAQFGVDPAKALDEDGKSYNLWGEPSCSLVCLTFEIACDHSDTEHVDATVTCTEDGRMEYWHCKDCGRYYKDEAMTKKVNEADLDVEALGHMFDEEGKCSRCGVCGDVSVRFTGDNADKVTDKSGDTENAGQEYKFKADRSKVYQVSNIIVDRPAEVDQDYYEPDSIALIENGNRNVDGKTVVNYDLYTTGNSSMINFIATEMDEDSFHAQYYSCPDWAYCYTVVSSDGTVESECDGWESYCYLPSLEAGQYYVYLGYWVGKGWSSMDQMFDSYELESKTAVFGLNIKKDTEVPAEEKTLMTEDDEGFYTIPAEDMKALTTVNVSVEMYPSDKVESLIDAIGDVTLEKESAIVAAREAYDALSDEDKAEVSPKAVLRLENAESELALLKAKTDDNAAIIDEMIASMKKTEALINDLRDQIDDLKESGEADEEMIADLEDQLEDLQGIVDDLKEEAATKEELQAKINDLNNTITELTNKINEMQTAAGTSSALDEKKAQAAEEINQYLADNSANILPADLLETEIAALKSIIKANSAKDEAGVAAAVSEAKSAIDAKVQIKADTDAAKALKVKGLKAKAKSRKFTVSWKKNADAEAYQVQYKLSSAKKFSSLKKSTKAVKVTSKKLKKGKKYIFQVRTIKTVNGKKVYGAWVKTKAVKCK